ncbi:hypothetical protein PROFUN_12415, partial [Planoprotostelium fungivorum]
MDYTRKEFDPPLVTRGFFPDSEEENDPSTLNDETEQKSFSIGGETLMIREFAFSPTNANFVWPNNGAVASFITDHQSAFEGRNILELGSGTGVLSIILRRKGFAVVSSDFSDAEQQISSNIEHNCEVNSVDGVSFHHHVPHTWGNPFPWARYHQERESLVEEMSAQATPLKLPTTERLDVLVATDILIYVEQYQSLVGTVVELLKRAHFSSPAPSRKCMLNGNAVSYPFFLMNIGRRLDTTPRFIEMMNSAGFKCTHLGKMLQRSQLLFEKKHSNGLGKQKAPTFGMDPSVRSHDVYTATPTISTMKPTLILFALIAACAAAPCVISEGHCPFPAAYFDFNDASIIALNSTTLNFNADIQASVNAATSIIGVEGLGLSLAASARAGVRAKAALRVSANFTLSSWINVQSVNSASLTIASTFNRNVGWDATYHPSLDTLVFTGSNGPSTLFMGVGVNIQAWTHVAVAVNEVSVSLYINGKLFGVKPLVGPCVASPLALSIGIQASVAARANSFIDEVAIFDITLSFDQISAWGSWFKICSVKTRKPEGGSHVTPTKGCSFCAQPPTPPPCPFGTGPDSPCFRPPPPATTYDNTPSNSAMDRDALYTQYLISKYSKRRSSTPGQDESIR